MSETVEGCEIIAEAGVNHDGDEGDALRLVQAAADAGAHAVKFQTFDPDELVTADAPTAVYQSTAGEGDRQSVMLRRLALPLTAWARIAAEARSLGIAFLSTPFDVTSARYLVEDLGMERIKVGSGELTNLPFLLELARMNRPLLISTGMATLAEVRDALGTVVFGRLSGPNDRPSMAAIREALVSADAAPILARTVVMQCVTAYPAPHHQANLRVLDTYGALGVIPGYSDHTLGLDVALAAVARGARVLEKHLTLDRARKGPDHGASLEPRELADLVVAAQRVTQALGSAIKGPVEIERINMGVARRGLVAARPIRAGEILGPETVVARRAGGGAAPGRLWALTGERAQKDYETGEWIEA